MSSKFLKRASLLFVTLIYAVVPAATVFAERVSPNVDETTIRNTLETLTTEARAATVANKVYNCLSNHYYDGNEKGTKVMDNLDSYVGGSWTQGATIGVGAWVEKKVGGSAVDGAVYCDENNFKLLKVMANLIDADLEDLVCSPDGTPGMVRKKNAKGSCDLSSSDKHEFNNNLGWWYHFQKYYDAYAEEMNWYYRWSDVANDNWVYPGVIGYSMYVAEIDVGCGHEAGATKPSTNYISVPLRYVNQYGEESKMWYYGSDTSYVVPKTSNSKHHSFVVRGNNKTCMGMMELANEDDKASAFREEVKGLIRDGCAAAYKEQYDRAVQEIASDDVSDENKETLQHAIDEYNAMNGVYTEPYGNDGLQCKDTTYLATVTQTDWVDNDKYADIDVDNAESEKNCYTNAGSLGWIVCPIIDGLGKFIQDMYVKIFEPALRLDVNLFSDSSDTLAAWNDFRSIGNIAFVIFFIFVIFSQLTGIGLDNYGIKKVLPKLIVSAILINLSFIICQIAVDVANIVGASLGQFLSRFPSQTVSEITVEGVSTPSSAWESFSSGLGTNVAIVAIVSAVTAIAVLSQGLAIIIPVIMFLITVVVSVLGTLVLLGIRQALAVILVVFSPLAFVCYMLPNTKSIFDKWYKMFKGLLLAYPISSALIYGGNMVSHILLNSANGNTWVVISAGVIAVAPIFFLPKAIQSSMGAIGNMVGHWTNRASGWGKATAGRRLEQNALITRRRDYNRMAREQKHHAKIGAYNATRSQKVLKKLGGKDIASMSKTQMAQYRAAQGMVDSENKSRQDVYASRFSKMDQAGLEKEFAGMANSDKLDAQMVSAAIDSLGAMDQGKMMDAVSKLSESEGWANMSQEDRSHIAATLGSQNGNAAAKAYSKILNSTPNGQKPARFRDALKDGSIASKIRDMDADTLASQDKDALDFISRTQYSDKTGGPSRSLINAFSDEQVRTAMVKSDGQSAKAQNLQSSLAQRDNLDQVIDNMNDEQVSQLSFDTVAGAAKTSKNSRKIWNSAFSRARAANNNPNFQGKVDKRFINGNGGGASGSSSGANGSGGGANGSGTNGNRSGGANGGGSSGGSNSGGNRGSGNA